MLDSKYMVKPSSIGEPNFFLGSGVGKVFYVDGYYDWTMSSDMYVKGVINNINKRLKEDRLEYKKNISDVKYSPKEPFSSVDCRLELDTSMEYNEDQVSLYQKIIGVLI